MKIFMILLNILSMIDNYDHVHPVKELNKV